MKKRLLTMLLVVLMVFGSMFAFAACKNDNTDDKHTSHPDANEDGYCDIGGEKLPDDGGKDDEEYSAPVITVTPAEMELTKGTSEDEYSLLFGVTVTDEYDQDLKATVKDDGGFDIDTIGDYTVTYSATNSKGKEGTGTRVYHVVAPLPNLVLKVQKENDAKNWVDTLGHTEALMTFPNEEYYELEEDTAYTASTKGVFHNKSTASIIVSIPGGYGEAVILNSAGAVVEARDGANGRLVNKDNPSRPSSTVTTLPEEWFEEPAEGETPNYKVADNYAFHMEIPADGYAIVIPNAGGKFDEDGRGWLNKNVVYQYGAAVQLYFEDAPEKLLTVYENQAPVVLSAETVIVYQGDGTTESEAEALLLKDLSYVDDSGTWDIADDKKSGLTVSIASKPTTAYDNATLGTYTYKLSISDGTKTTEFSRDIMVREPLVTMPTIKINGKWYEFDEGNILVNPAVDTANIATKSAIIYTSYFAGEYFANNYGFYFIVDANGKIRETLTPYSGGKISRYDTDGTTVKEETITTTDVLANVKGNLKTGEYVVLAVNGGARTNSGATGVDLRVKLGDAYTASETNLLGATVEMELISWMPTITVTKADGSKVSYSGTKIIVNADGKDAAKQSFLVYTKAYQAEKLNTNGWGIAIVLDAEGKIVKVYDGVNGKYWDKDNDGVAAGTFFAAASYAQDAFDDLGEDETLVVFPNDGVNADGSPRKFGYDNVCTLGLTVTFSNFEIAVGSEEEEEPTDELQIKIGSATLTVVDVAINENNAVTKNYDVLIFTHGFTGTYTNGYGYAAVVKDRKIVRVYDGFSGKYFDADNSGGIKDDSKCTAAGYAAESIASLQEGEFVIIFPNGGKGGNDVRTWGGSNARTVGATVELVNITLA